MPTGSLVLGLDVNDLTNANNSATNNNPITEADWSNVKNPGGRDFVIIKASEGTYYTDNEALLNSYVLGATQARLTVGVYHFATPNSVYNVRNTSTFLAEADDEADYFVGVARSYIATGYLQPALDLDSDPTSCSDFINSSDPADYSSLAAWADEWIAEVQRKIPGYTLKPFVYVGQDAASELAGASPSLAAESNLWIADPSTPGNPSATPKTGAWSTWAVMQYDWYGTVDGITNVVLLDVLNPAMPLSAIEIGQPVTIPTVTTTAATAITAGSAASGGNVSADGGSAVTARGVCWATSANPTVADSLTEDGSGTGDFTSQLSDLAAETTYYLRAYATNLQGTAYGNQQTFTTLGSSSGGHTPCAALPAAGLVLMVLAIRSITVIDNTPRRSDGKRGKPRRT
jgi:GH25 family lysozyme M1 (1,4-beta-N-acetylmuramidase)